MGLSHELVSQFAKVIKETKKQNTESIVYGTVKTDANGNKYVQLDGSDQLTPLSDDNQPALDSATITAKENDRVTVLIKNHNATVIGNVSSPAVNTDAVEQSISNFDYAIIEQLQAERGYFKDLIADNAEINKLTAAIISVVELIATEAEIENLVAGKITVTDLIADKIDADVIVSDKAVIDMLKANSATILSLIADNATIENLIANKATINSLVAEKLSAKDADIKYANIDFANIGEAAIIELFSKSGIIRDLVMSEGHVTGKLVGVTIIGDLIEGGTIKADKLVVLGEDGLYYKLNVNANTVTGEQTDYNSLNGKIITAKSITAEKVHVDDLVAFDATIGGFNITENAIYSGVKSSVDNTTMGIYLDDTGQIAFGDSKNYIKFYRIDENNTKLEISAASIVMSSSGKTVEKVIEEVESKLEGLDEIEIGGRNLLRGTRDFSGFYSNRNTTEIVSEGLEYSYVNFPVVDALDYRAISSTLSMINVEDIIDRNVVISFEVRSDTAWTSNGDNILIGFSLCNDESTTRLRYATPRFTEEITTEWVRHSLAVTLNDEFFVNGTVSLDECTRFYVQLYNHSLNQLQVRKFKMEYGTVATDWSPAPEDVERDIADTNTELREVISENHTSIIKDCEQIIFGALESYTETNDFETFKQITESQLKVLSDEMTLQFSKTTEHITEMNDSLQSQLNTITKYFTFDINGLTIGQVDSPYKVIIDNDRYSMTVNDVEVMWIADGKVYTPEIEVTRAFKLFGYTIEQDQNGNVNCAYVGGES